MFLFVYNYHNLKTAKKEGKKMKTLTEKEAKAAEDKLKNKRLNRLKANLLRMVERIEDGEVDDAEAVSFLRFFDELL